MERLFEEILKNYKNLCVASKALGRTSPYLYMLSRLKNGDVKKIYRICKELKLDFTYIIDGESGEFNKEIDYKPLLEIVNAELKKPFKTRIKLTGSERVIVLRIKQGKSTDMSIKVLRRFAEKYDKKPTELL